VSIVSSYCIAGECLELSLELVTTSPLQPWEANPYQLISWSEMLEFSAKAFFRCGSILKALRIDCLIGSAISIDDEPVFLMTREIDEKTKRKALHGLNLVESEFRKIGMLITAETVKETSVEVEKQQHNTQWLLDQLKVIEGLAHKELNGKTFLYVPAEQAKFFPRKNEPQMFGESVATAFPSATYDISESAICLALARGSACVFHLMRVLEIGLGLLGAVFHVSLEHTSWGPAIDEIESKIRNMHKDEEWKSLPDCKEQQQFYSQAASHFGILKDAWRNYTMHKRSKYTLEEAELIFKSVKDFMQKLAGRLSEP
jgi:hypothetical protein